MKRFVLTVLSLFISISASAFETDQYSLPDRQLADSGPEISAWIHANLKAAVENAKQDASQKELLEDFLKRLSHCDIGWAKFQYAKTAGFCISRYVEKELLKDDPAKVYLPKPSIFTAKSVPGLFGWFFSDERKDRDTFWRAFAPTARMYNVLVGLDKIGHFMKLGRDYYLHYLEVTSKGLKPEDADRSAVEKIGAWHELHFFGKGASGIYSNADLATNFAGLKFYQRLFLGVKTDYATIPPLLVKGQDGRWTMSDYGTPEILLEPFISIHMNEALNPNWFTDKRASRIRDEIAKRCPQWKTAYPDWTAENFNDLAESLKKWNGMEYGHREQPGGAFSLGRVCNQ